MTGDGTQLIEIEMAKKMPPPMSYRGSSRPRVPGPSLADEGCSQLVGLYLGLRIRPCARVSTYMWSGLVRIGTVGTVIGRLTGVEEMDIH